MKFIKLFSILLLIPATFLFAQDESDSDVEEVVVVGSQIKGAKITGALPVSVITSEDIEALAVESGDELFAELAENGSNNFNQTDFSGGYNANRGDVGSLDLRNIGTGNTVTLLNGRRLVQAPSYATEWLGGSYVPVQSVNSNTIPVYGAERIEILRDGASAIYGADAVAGVINTVLKTDFDGFSIRTRANWFDGFDAKDNKLSIQWGKTFADGTNVSVYFDRYDRERVRGIEDPKWANGDLRRFLPGVTSGDPLGEFNDTTFRNLSGSSVWAQFYTDGMGPLCSTSNYNAGKCDPRNPSYFDSNIFTMYRPDDTYCKNFDLDAVSGSNFYYIPGQTNMCLYDGSSTTGRDANRANYGDTWDARGPMLRNNLVVFVNTELENGIEAYTEFSYYESDVNRNLYGGAMLGLGNSARYGQNTQPLYIPASNYYLQQIQRASGSAFLGREAEWLWARYHRFSTVRGYDAHKNTWRVVQGFRGDWNDWDWDSGIVLSKATSEVDNYGRANLTLLDQALAKDTPDAYNPFCAGFNCNEEQFMTTVFRNNYSELMMVDLKMSNNSLFSMPAGDAAALFGVEVRKESMDDQRDPNLNGEIAYTVPEPPARGYDICTGNGTDPITCSDVPNIMAGTTFPYISNIANSSPSPNTYGERITTSLFAELQIPLLENLNSQIAVRAENADDFGSFTVGKFALGYQPFNALKLRSSISTSFRAPNLITMNEGLVVRNNSQEDPLYTAAIGENYPNYSIQRVAEGNDDLDPEESTNSSIGIVLTPGNNWTITVDKWQIEQENTIGLFGERNHLLLDTLIRKQGGVNECTGNPLVTRGEFIPDEDTESDTYNGAWDANLCQVGQVIRVNDVYVNLDNRTLKGTDYLVQYRLDTDYGYFSAKLMRVSFDEFSQEAGGATAQLIAAGEPGGPLDGLINVAGYGDLLGTYDKRPYWDFKDTLNLSWKHNSWQVMLSGRRVSEFIEVGVTDNAKSVDVSGTANDVYQCSGTNTWTSGVGTCGDPWIIDEMLTLNLTLGYRFKSGLRLRGSIINLEDTRAPLADEYRHAHVSDVHNDYGRRYSLEFYKKF